VAIAAAEAPPAGGIASALCRRWAILTVEYPPQVGGVSDYSRSVAHGLAERGDDVHVWAPPCDWAAPKDRGVTVYRLPSRFGPSALRSLTRGLGALPRPYQLLIQYVPQGFGWRGLNPLFWLWLRRRRQEAPWVMFHEVATPIAPSQSLARNIQGYGTRIIAHGVASAAARVFTSIPAWAGMLGKRTAVQWLPVPSGIPTIANASRTAAIRDVVSCGKSGPIIGHFGVAARDAQAVLCLALAEFLHKTPDSVAVFVGRRSVAIVDEMRSLHPKLEGRLHATGVIPGDEVAAYLAACDLLLQPFPDGVSSRRTSLMAGLALGKPIVTVSGALTEPLWRESGAVALAGEYSPAALVASVNHVLADHSYRTDLGKRASALYVERFALERTIAALRAPHEQ
jgi:glycosyltransferase involved in cell wall biosynthesis